MSRNHAGGDVARALDLNNRGNLSICYLIYPFIAFIWIFAEPLIAFLYTDSYVDAVPVLRVYALNMLATSVELATVLLIYEQGRFVMLVSAGVLFGASLLSYAGALSFGLPGVAIGGLVGTIITRMLNFNRAAKVLQVGLGEIQDWSTLSRMLLASVLSGIVARVLTNLLPAAAHPLLVLILGFAILGAAYLGLTFLLRFSWVPICMLGRRPWPESSNSLQGNP
jgi:peptidoglycan biosynthesis protein MviN/MurJ (putative lipid II flippase)